MWGSTSDLGSNMLFGGQNLISAALKDAGASDELFLSRLCSPSLKKTRLLNLRVKPFALNYSKHSRTNKAKETLPVKTVVLNNIIY